MRIPNIAHINWYGFIRNQTDPDWHGIVLEQASIQRVLLT